MSSFQKKSSSLFVTIFIGFIIISFMFTGYESMRGTPDTVASVGGEDIRFREYQSEYNRQLEFYRQFTGGDLSSQQIEQFGLRESSVNNLVSGRLMTQFASNMGVIPSQGEVAEQIKTLPFFQTNNRFDIERYKALLAANGLTPADFEADIEQDLKRQQSQTFFKSFPISNRYLEDVQAFRAKRVKAQVVRIGKESMRKNIKVTDAEIKEFFETETNAKRVEVIFEERKPTLDQKEEVKARHILMAADESNSAEIEKKMMELRKKASARNFIKLANENTEDPSGKENGGDLGWFAADGMMVPEFEEVAFKMKKGEISQPIKTDFGWHIIYVEDKKEAKEAVFEDYRKSIATELIQRNKTEELDQLISDVKARVESNMNSDKVAALDALQKTYDFQFDKNTEINPFDGNKGPISLTREQITEIFSAEISEKTTKSFEDANQIILTRLEPQPLPNTDVLMTQLQEERTGLSTLLSRKLQEEVLEAMREQVTVKVYSNRIR